MKSPETGAFFVVYCEMESEGGGKVPPRGTRTILGITGGMRLPYPRIPNGTDGGVRGQVGK